ncbi:MAG: pyrroline-5-carboxylate reductase [Bacteroidales bacterium]|nr:pyrroline-5-carboxylate reductase [Bacteroidales bacterium]
MKINNITIVGGGNLGSAIAKGILAIKEISADKLIICEKRKLRIDYLKEAGFKNVDSNIKNSVKDADLVIVSVKPQQFTKVLEEIKPNLKKNQILISTVTGASLAQIASIIKVHPTVRIMPNTAIEIKESMTCMCFNNTSGEQEELIFNLFNKMGKSIVLQEDLLDAVTVLGACGIAFALRFIRAATQGGIEIGFGSELSQLIVSQTVKGAAHLLLENNSHPESEIDKVTTPQGITISGLNEMEHQGFSSSVIKGLITSFNKLSAIETNNI